MAVVIMKLAEFQRHKRILAFLILPRFVCENMNETDSWSVTIVKWRPLRKCSHLRAASIIAVASFSTAEYRFSQAERVRDINATGRPSCDNAAASAKSDASVSTSKGTPSWIEARLALCRSFFNVLNAITASLLRGKALQCKRGPAFFEKFGIHFA